MTVAVSSDASPSRCAVSYSKCRHPVLSQVPVGRLGRWGVTGPQGEWGATETAGGPASLAMRGHQVTASGWHRRVKGGPGGIRPPPPFCPLVYKNTYVVCTRPLAIFHSSQLIFCCNIPVSRGCVPGPTGAYFAPRPPLPSGHFAACGYFTFCLLPCKNPGIFAKKLLQFTVPYFITFCVKSYCISRRHYVLRKWDYISRRLLFKIIVTFRSVARSQTPAGHFAASGCVNMCCSPPPPPPPNLNSCRFIRVYST